MQEASTERWKLSEIKLLPGMVGTETFSGRVFAQPFLANRQAALVSGLDHDRAQWSAEVERLKKRDLDRAGAFIPQVSPALKARDYKGPSSDGDGDGAPLIAHSLRAQAQSTHAADLETYVPHSLRGEGLAPNPLYLRGAKRVGCWPCVFLSKDQLAMVAAEDPAKIDVIEDLEHEVNKTNKKGNASFYTLRPDGVKHIQAPIRDVVEWAQTDKGGKQFRLPLVEDPPDIGCVRWGLCDTAPERA